MEFLPSFALKAVTALQIAPARTLRMQLLFALP